MPLLLAAQVWLVPQLAQAGEFDGWGLVFVPVEASFADCATFDVTALTCTDGMAFGLGTERPIFLWVVGYHGTGFWAGEIAEIGARIFMDPPTAAPAWTTCGWSDTVIPSSAGIWGRDFAAPTGECATAYVEETSGFGFVRLGFFEIGDEPTELDSGAGQLSYWVPCGSGQSYRPCEGIGATYSVEDGNAHVHWHGCDCAPAVEPATWGQVKAEYAR